MSPITISGGHVQVSTIIYIYNLVEQSMTLLFLGKIRPKLTLVISHIEIGTYSPKVGLPRCETARSL